MHMERTEVVVIGGGPAGLQAALTLGRIHRPTVVLDSGEYRNAAVAASHNTAGSDGASPTTMRNVARADLGRYPLVQVRDVLAQSVDVAPGGFVVTTDDGPISTRAVVLATGVVDELPAIPGLDEAWGREAANCPFCHAHEAAGRHIGILAGRGTVHFVDQLTPIAGELTVFGNGQDVPDMLAPVEPAAIQRIVRTDGRLRLELEGRNAEVDALFLTAPLRQRAPFVHDLGLALADTGEVIVDDAGRTSIPGIYAAGDMARRDGQPWAPGTVLKSAASGQAAAIACHGDLLRTPRPDTDPQFWQRRYSANEAGWSGQPNPMLVEAARGLKVGSALDVGCGEGADAIWLAEQGWRVTGIDVAPAGLQRAQDEARSRGVDVSWVAGDLEATSGQFDLVTCAFVHPNRGERLEFWRALGERVAPGGHLVVLVHDYRDLGSIARPPYRDFFARPSEIAGALAGAFDLVTGQVQPLERPCPDGGSITVHDGLAVLRKR